MSNMYITVWLWVWMCDDVSVPVRGSLSGVDSVLITMVPGLKLRSSLLPEPACCCPLLNLLKYHHEVYKLLSLHTLWRLDEKYEIDLYVPFIPESVCCMNKLPTRVSVALLCMTLFCDSLELYLLIPGWYIFFCLIHALSLLEYIISLIYFLTEDDDTFLITS